MAKVDVAVVCGLFRQDDVCFVLFLQTQPILAACEHYDVPLIEDAAEALGTLYQGRTPGWFGKAGIFSFNG